MKIIGIDPGETTGIAICDTDELPHWRWKFDQLGPEEHHLELSDLLEMLYPSRIVYERFENRGNQAARLVSCEYIGVIKRYAQAHYRHQEVIVQSASQAKAFWTNDKLKAILLWKGNDLKHAMDATRHVLYYLMQSKQLPEEYLEALRRTTG
jgi:hypothetical protein